MMDQNTVEMKNKTYKKAADVPEDWLTGADIKEDKYYSISNVSSMCNNIKPYVLRYWESQFKDFSPVRKNSRRYYRRQDIIMARNIYFLVHLKRYTIEGAQKYLSSSKEKNATDNIRSDLPFSKVLNSLKEIEDILNNKK